MTSGKVKTALKNLLAIDFFSKINNRSSPSLQVSVLEHLPPNCTASSLIAVAFPSEWTDTHLSDDVRLFTI
jgi:hypothetical protein